MRKRSGPVPLQVGPPTLDEGHRQLGGKELELGERNQRNCYTGGGKTLKEKFGARSQPQVAALDDFDVVVGKADGSEGEGRTDGDPDEGIGGVGPEHSGKQDGDNDKDAAHSGGARFSLVRLGAVFADVLADLEFVQLLNDVGADE